MIRRPLRRFNNWERCINCKVFARNGAIRHLHTCPDYVRPRPGTTSVSFGDVVIAARRWY